MIISRKPKTTKKQKKMWETRIMRMEKWFTMEQTSMKVFVQQENK